MPWLHALSHLSLRLIKVNAAKTGGFRSLPLWVMVNLRVIENVFSRHDATKINLLIVAPLRRCVK